MKAALLTSTFPKYSSTLILNTKFVSELTFEKFERKKERHKKISLVMEAALLTSIFFKI